MSKFGGEQGLANPPDHSSFHHGAYSGQDGFQIDSGLFSDVLKGIPLEAAHKILGDLEDFRIDRIIVIRWNRGEGFNAHERPI
jgi:hypothetical protein